MRGVYLVMPRPKARRQGSSPHARGLLAPGMPAARALMDHPRMRGVYNRLTDERITIRGSSPHARGLLSKAALVRAILRIIPACAGFTLGDPWNPNGPGAYHPPVSFTADLVPARQSCGSAAVEPRWTTTPWAA